MLSGKPPVAPLSVFGIEASFISASTAGGQDRTGQEEAQDGDMRRAECPTCEYGFESELGRGSSLVAVDFSSSLQWVCLE